MPNWCVNSVKFSHSDTAAIQRVAEAYKTGEFMTQFFPCPQELRDTTSGFFSDPVEQAKLMAQQAANQLKYGYSTWYEWMNDNWGTKWDFGNENADTGYKPGDTELTLSFDTAWGPPTAFYEKMVDELGYNIKAYYYEPGMAFCGIWDDGEDTSYKIPSSSAKVADVIPSALDEVFGITEQMKSYEEEEVEA